MGSSNQIDFDALVGSNIKSESGNKVESLESAFQNNILLLFKNCFLRLRS